MANTTPSRPVAASIHSNDPNTDANALFPPHFSPHTKIQEDQNEKTASLIEKPLGPRAQRSGYVYVAKQADTRFCKVGWAGKDANARMRAINNTCQVVTEGSYRVGPFYGAFRAEQLVHSLLLHCRHLRKNCPCGCENREWYQVDHTEILYQVQMVYTWMCRNPRPYEKTTTGETLLPVWENALRRWRATQDGRIPLTWTEFFLLGPSLDVVVDRLSYPSSHPLSSPPLTEANFHRAMRPLLETLGSMVAPRRGADAADVYSLEPDEDGESMSIRFRPRPSNADDQRSPNVTSDAGAMRDGNEEVSDEAARPKRQETWDYWFVPPETRIIDNVVSEAIAIVSETTESDPTRASGIFYSPASVHSAEHFTTEENFQELDDTAANHAGDLAGTSKYYDQVTIVVEERSATPDQDRDAETADLGRGSFSNSEGNLSSRFSEMLALMPGAFPTKPLEYCPPTDMCLSNASDVAYDYQSFIFVAGAYGILYSIRDRFRGHGTFLVGENNIVIWTPAKPPISDELCSEVLSRCRTELQMWVLAYAGLSGQTRRREPARLLLTNGQVDGQNSPSPACSSLNASASSVPAEPATSSADDERCRLDDRHEGEPPEEDSDCESSSSWSSSGDLIRSKVKQRCLEWELAGLGRERDCFEHNVDYRTLIALAPKLPIWDDWSDEPSEDESEDKTWTDDQELDTRDADEERGREPEASLGVRPEASEDRKAKALNSPTQRTEQTYVFNESDFLGQGWKFHIG